MFYGVSDMIREISKKEIPVCVEVIRKSFRTVAADLGFTEENAPRFTAFATTIERLEWQFTVEHRPMFAYFEDNQVIGYYSLQLSDEWGCELNNLCVLPEYRHNKIGQKLLENAFHVARKLHCREIKIGIVEENQLLRRWYERFGFVHTGTEKFDFFPFTCGYMVKQLNQKGILLFDLDGTLLRNDKTLSEYTLKTLSKCREDGYLIGISTSRGEQNCLSFLRDLEPDILISSGGALVQLNGNIIYTSSFSVDETRKFIEAARDICGSDCEITVDSLDAHYWNYKTCPGQQDKSWGDSIYTDFIDFEYEALKICVLIPDTKLAEKLCKQFSELDSKRFSDGDWYKFTKGGITKEKAISEVCKACNMDASDIIAFGDDYADIGMLKLCGIGVAMGNAIQEVKDIADVVTLSNEEDGVAVYLEDFLKMSP